MKKQDIKHPGIVTHSGNELEVMNPAVEDIRLEDIADGLSRERRFSGLTRGRRYNVAHHSLVVESILDMFLLADPETVTAGLFHDATEAYLGDVIAPLKRFLPDYNKIEDIWSTAIGARFGILPSAFHSTPVKMADHMAYSVEVYFLVNRVKLYGFESREALRKVVLPILEICPLARSIETPWAGPESVERFLAAASSRFHLVAHAGGAEIPDTLRIAAAPR